MVNHQSYLIKEKPVSTPTPYGARVAFVAPNGIKKIAEESSDTEKWATGGNILVYLNNGRWVECSITYVHSIPNVSTGWKFWYKYQLPLTDKGVYQSITDPTGHSVALTLKNVNGVWKAVFQDVTLGTSNTFDIPNAPDLPLALTGSSNLIMMESSNGSCPSYINFNQIDFDNFRYLQSNGSFTNQIPATTGGNPAAALSGCIAVDQSTDRIYHT
ncbi:MAG: hypothetical protein ACK4TO_05920 [Candidatus Nitrosotenuis sp.]